MFNCRLQLCPIHELSSASRQISLLLWQMSAAGVKVVRNDGSGDMMKFVGGWSRAMDFINTGLGEIRRIHHLMVRFWHVVLVGMILHTDPTTLYFNMAATPLLLIEVPALKFLEE